MQPYKLVWENTCNGSIISVAATSNCSTICAATVGRSLYLYNGEGLPLWTSPYDTEYEAWATAISEDSQVIAVGTANKKPADGSLFVLDRDKHLIWSYRVRFPVWSVSLSSDGQTLAASTWGDNTLYIFRKNGLTYELSSKSKIPGKHGLYGVKLTANGVLCAVASYEEGLFLVEQNGSIASSITYATGFYNIALASQANTTAIVGTRDGCFLCVQFDDETVSTRLSKSFSQRPICGISVTDNGLLVATGSFDGRIILTNDLGDILWDYQTKGEVWTTAISSSGRFVCAGCGDHKLRFFHNYCDTAAYKEIKCLEDSLPKAAASGATSILQTLINLYIKYGLVSYGYQKLTSLIHEHQESHIFKDQLKQFLRSAAVNENATEDAHFKYASQLASEQKYHEAVLHFQQAAKKPSLRSDAHRRAAECFAEMRFSTAATSAWRQSREQFLDENARHILFSLARSYEDKGLWRQASKIYEMIISWDIDFRNALDKLNMARNFSFGSTVDFFQPVQDYTGSTVSLLGPDAPHEGDDSLKSIISARSKEVLITSEDIQQVHDVVKDLLEDKVYSCGIRRDFEHFDYDIRMFAKYEYGLPEDEMKKFLETVNTLPHIMSKIDIDEKPSSLDIGSATGRYPSLLARLGFQATGLDIEPGAIEYSKKKVSSQKYPPRFICGDAITLANHLDSEEYFNVITCMMGTFQHIPLKDQQTVIHNIHTKLKPNGIAIISVWDTECPHLAYLSMYDETQKDKIRQNSRTREEIVILFKNADFEKTLIVPFCLLPQTIIYDLGIERMHSDDVNIAAQADLAARALFHDRHGEMFIAIGYKSDSKEGYFS